jgi:OPA family glycerol-3-phosphate transporter-like MFS transporter
LGEVKHFDIKATASAYAIYEFAAIPGTLLCGWMSDKVFKGKRGLTGFVFMVMVTIAVVVFWMNPATPESELAHYATLPWYKNPYQLTDFAMMTVIGFLIYGPVMLIGLHALELAPKKAAGTAAGFTGLFGYLGGTVAASAVIGWAADTYGWNGGFYIMIGGSVLACVLMLITMVEEAKHKAKIAEEDRLIK